MKMQHVTIQTRYFEEEIGFYEKFCGLKIQRDLRPDKDLVFLSDENCETSVEIIRNPEAEESGNNNFSIGFRTDDVSLIREDFIIRGIETTDIISPGPKVSFFFTKDPAGVQVQFIED